MKRRQLFIGAVAMIAAFVIFVIPVLFNLINAVKDTAQSS